MQRCIFSFSFFFAKKEKCKLRINLKNSHPYMMEQAKRIFKKVCNLDRLSLSTCSSAYYGAHQSHLRGSGSQVHSLLRRFPYLSFIEFSPFSLF